MGPGSALMAYFRALASRERALAAAKNRAGLSYCCLIKASARTGRANAARAHRRGLVEDLDLYVS